MNIGIFIEYDGRVIQFPVNPQSFNVSTGGNNKSSEIITLGDVVIPRKRKLSSISWESWFPYEPWFPAIRTKGSFQSAQFYLQFLNKIREDCRPCRLFITGINYDQDVVIDSFDYHHQAGDHEDTYYSIKFTEYRDYTISVMAKTTNNALKTETAVGTVAPKSSSSPASPVPTEITIGSEVILNGRVHRDSYGAGPGKTFSNYRGKVNLINKKGSHPYHVTSSSGSWLGWVTKESVVLA